MTMIPKQVSRALTRARPGFSSLVILLFLLVLPAGSGLASGIGGDKLLAASAQCEDGIDNDADGEVDLASSYCKVAADDDESSFASGIAGDDMNSPDRLDCFFDTNSGAGDDGCSVHACCLIDGPCPSDLRPDLFDPGSCTVTQQCRDACLPLVKVGCDCFGCCEICVPGSGDCVEVLVNPAVSPECRLDTLSNASQCRSCTRNAECKVLPERIFADGFETMPATPRASTDRARAACPAPSAR